MTLMAMVCNAMVGYGARKAATRGGSYLVLPLILSTSFFLIADIDSHAWHHSRRTAESIEPVRNFVTWLTACCTAMRHSARKRPLNSPQVQIAGAAVAMVPVGPSLRMAYRSSRIHSMFDMGARRFRLYGSPWRLP